MAGNIRVFEQGEGGRLIEIAPEARGDRQTRRVALEIDVLLTDEEIAERAAEAAAAAQADAKRREDAAALRELQEEIAGRLGLTVEEAQLLLR